MATTEQTRQHQGTAISTHVAAGTHIHTSKIAAAGLTALELMSIKYTWVTFWKWTGIKYR